MRGKVTGGPPQCAEVWGHLEPPFAVSSRRCDTVHVGISSEVILMAFSVCSRKIPLHHPSSCYISFIVVETSGRFL